LPFTSDPSVRVAEYLDATGYRPDSCLLVVPTQRFKSYLAAQLLRLSRENARVLPGMISMVNLLHDLAAGCGKQIAGEGERLVMLYRACLRSGRLGSIIPEEALNSFRQFRAVAAQLLKSFHELAAEEISPDPPENGTEGLGSCSGGPGGAGETGTCPGGRLQVLFELYGEYLRVQREEGVYDAPFLYPSVRDGDLDRYFRHWEHILLVTPLALTRFERRVFGSVEDRLVVMYQEDESHDFSSILTFGGSAEVPASGSAPGKQPAAQAEQPGAQEKHLPAQAEQPGTSAPLRRFEASSRMDQVMLCLGLVSRALESGCAASRIAVINLDPLFSEMLYDAFQSLGVQANLSGGRPLSRSPLYHFLCLAGSYFGTGGESACFLDLIRDPFFKELAAPLPPFREIKRRVNDDRMFRVHPGSGLVRETPGLARALGELEVVYRSAGFIQLLSGLAGLFAKLKQDRTYQYNAVRRLLLDTAIELTDLDPEGTRSPSLPLDQPPFEIFLQAAGARRYQEPGSMHRGVQIMGLLETRGVSFDTVVVPSFNEGFFPVRSDDDLFLSVQARRSLGMNTFMEREELEFYYLKRILDSSRNASLIVLRNSSDEYEVASRFGVLLDTRPAELNELPLPLSYAPEQGFERVMAGAKSIPGEKELPRLHGGVTALSRMDIHRIKQCPVQYYIARVLGVYEPAGLSGRIELNLVGGLVHELFHRLYQDIDFDRSVPSREALEDRMLSLFHELFPEGLFPTREEVLMKELLKRNLLACIRRDHHRFSGGFRPVTDLMEHTLEARIREGQEPVTISGRIDRVDLSPGGGYVIMDYKTGSVPPAGEHKPERGFQVVQLAVYGLLFRENYPEAEIEALGYFDVNHLGREQPVITGEEVGPYLDQFQHHLAELADGLRGSELQLPPDTSPCTWCPYYLICRIFEP
jgi:RecB family exonuclease